MAFSRPFRLVFQKSGDLFDLRMAKNGSIAFLSMLGNDRDELSGRSRQPIPVIFPENFDLLEISLGAPSFYKENIDILEITPSQGGEIGRLIVSFNNGRRVRRNQSDAVRPGLEEPPGVFFPGVH